MEERKLIKYYSLLFSSFLFLIFSFIFERETFDKSEILNSNIVINPYKKHPWKEQINILISKDGHYHTTLTLKEEEENNIIVFSLFGILSREKENSFKIKSTTKSMYNKSELNFNSEIINELYDLNNFTIIDYFDVIYRDKKTIIIERKHGNIKSLMLTRE